MLPKERTAWVWFICLLIVPTTYFVLVFNLPTTNNDLDLARLKSLSVALMAMALVAIFIRIYNYKLRSQDGSPSIDERDHLIEQTGVSKAYPTLIGGMILVGFVMPFNSGKWQIIDTAFFSIVLAELVHYGFVLRSYRAENNA
jgi:uncharacterized membrane protein